MAFVGNAWSLFSLPVLPRYAYCFLTFMKNNHSFFASRSSSTVKSACFLHETPWSSHLPDEYDIKYAYRSKMKLRLVLGDNSKSDLMREIYQLLNQP